jgi:uncharacterized protein YoxC
VNPSDEGVDVTLDGREVDEAVAAVVEADAGRDPERVRALLGHVVTDGVVSRDAAADAVAHAARVVSTPETRVELAEAALADARVTAEHVADLDVVAARFDRFEERLETLVERLNGVAEELDAVVDAQGQDDLYAIARGVETVTAEANSVQRAADELSTDVESFERWVDDPGTRYDRLADDADVVAETIDALETTVERLSAAVETSDSDDTEVALPSDNTVEPAVAWFEVAVRYRTSSLLFADLRNESSTLETWADREGEDPPPAELFDRLESLGDRVDALGDQIDRLGRSAWTERFGDRLDSVDARFDSLEPPVDWGAVRETLDQYGTDAS